LRTIVSLHVPRLPLFHDLVPYTTLVGIPCHK
jgi:hypothetical protein